VTAFSNVVAAVERVTRIRRRFDTKVKADCPLCERRNRLEVAQLASGLVVFICHGGCAREALRERIGLPWTAYFEEVSYEPVRSRSAVEHVLRAIDGTRWTITEHAFGGDLDLALAVEIVERVLPARHRVRNLLRFRTGQRIEWNVFPLSVGFVQDVARKLGLRVGEHRAARLIWLLQERGVIEPVEPFMIMDKKTGPRQVRVFRLPLRTVRSWDKQLREALEATARSRSPGSSHDPATWTVLSARDPLSSLGEEVGSQLRAARDVFGGLGRSPPALDEPERSR